MKKLLTALTALVATAAPISATVSCKKAELAEGVVGQRVVMVTDAGNIHDHSFNEGAWEAIIQYGMNIHEKFGIENEEEARALDYASSVGENQWNPEKKNFGEVDFKKAKEKNKNFVEVREGSGASGFTNAYNTAISRGADAIFLAGFKHNDTVQYAAERMGEKTVVFLDGTYKGNRNNVISIVYKSELAGFNAGWDALMWANLPKMTSLNSGEFDPEAIQKSAEKKVNEIPVQGSLRDKSHVSVGMFGGISIKNAVDDFLWGLLAAMNLYNDVMAGQTVKLKDVKNNEVEYTLQKVEFANGKGSESQRQDVKSIDALEEVDWFSSNFESGGATRSSVMPKLFKNQADIIFPVAGAQTNDVLSYNEEDAKIFKPYVIGVDADQVISIGDERIGTNKRFITSAKKNIISASVYALERAKSLQEAIVGGKTYKNSKYAGETKDGQVLNGEQADWSISSSRSADQKWDAGKDGIITNSANLAVQSIDYEKGSSKIVSKKLENIFKESGSKFNEYFSSKSLNNFVEQVKKELTDKKWAESKLNEEGIAGIQDYLNLLNRTNIVNQK
ncbi:BMP family ABC transporter substrate-binding protein [Mycoplasma sp. HU2014]|uniref:BMP family ABC transporter substrate-binding protein n=1 Tax=Mycoplasma sp. HU2014 TaxID=1664275 RepID=UPI00067D92F9|nr:BMP family ABC transporter substrate-binding protein [Mycoplasma sp. HU2014]KNG79205.1 putative sugar ABC transporter substrate-binding lipoprotein [Mycoplasma sp. HU2014]